MSIIIYHNPRCRKSRETLQLIQNEGYEPTIHNYLKEPLSREEIREILKLLNCKAESLVRKTESLFKDNYKNKELSEEQWISILVDHPKLIERPIVVKDDKAVVGRPPENVMSIL